MGISHTECSESIGVCVGASFASNSNTKESER